MTIQYRYWDDFVDGFIRNIHMKVYQFTGICDCTNNEIYDGDIVKTVTGEIGTITWFPERARFLAKYDDGSTSDIADTMEIIGNTKQGIVKYEKKGGTQRVF